MEITEVRIKLVDDSEDKLQAFATVTLDGCFVVRDLKIIDGNNGLFVAMPSRKLTRKCTRCGCKNHLRSSYCNDCGGQLPQRDVTTDDLGRPKLHVDVAHPINQGCREYIQTKILEAFQKEIMHAKGATAGVVTDAPPVSALAPAPVSAVADSEAEVEDDAEATEDDDSKETADGGEGGFGMGIFS